MFCPNCGATINDNAIICVHCATEIRPTKPYTRKEFLALKASKKTKDMVLVQMGLAILCIILAIVSIFTSLNTAIYDIPVFELVMGDEMDEFEEIFDEARDEFEDMNDDRKDDILDEAKMTEKEMTALLRKPTLSKITKLSYVILDDTDAIAAITVFNGIIIAYGIFIAIFEVLALLLKHPACAIVAVVVSLLYFFLFAGALMFVLFLVANVSQIIAYTMANKEYKEYKKSLM